MNTVDVFAAIKSAFVDAVGHSNVYWKDEDNSGNWAPYNVSKVLLQTTSIVKEADPREEQDTDEGETVMSCSYVFTVTATAEDLQNTGQAMQTLLTARNRFEFSEFRDTWAANGIAIVDLPLSPTRLNYTQDRRILNVVAFDVQIRAVVTDTIDTVSYLIERVTGEGTLIPGDVPVPFDADAR